MSFISYAQNFEDVMLWRALKHIDNGFYLDVGAQDPVNDSVSKAFYDRGWRGISIEPVPKYAELLRKAKPDDTVLEVALSNVEGLIDLYVIPDTGLSSALESYKDQAQGRSNNEPEKIQVQALTLKSVAMSLGGKDVHWLKIDVEGLEEKVLLGWDSRLLRPWIIVVEATVPNSSEENYSSWDPIVISANYQFAYFDGLNRFYVANEHPELLAAFSYPPNFFDDFEVAESSRLCRSLIKAQRGLQVEVEAQRLAMSSINNDIRTLNNDIRTLFSRRLLRWIFKLSNWPEIKALSKNIEIKKNGLLQTVVVDLTPVLPGGENGGAKIFVLELLRRLSEMATQTQFILLTQAAAHEELAAMDGPNMRRLMVVGSAAESSPSLRVQRLAIRILPYLPNRLRGIVARVGYRVVALLKRKGSSTLLRNLGADLLFCPFTAPTYFEAGIPTVCTIYDLQYKTYPEFFQAADVANRDQTFSQACRRATSLAAISNYSRDSAILQGSLNPTHIRTIYLRMAQRMTPEAKHDNNVLHRLGLDPKKYLIYPANFWKHKNHEMLLTAFGIACHGGLAADIKLVCTGAPGERQDWLLASARAMTLGDRVLFPGYLPNSELAALIANCAGVVFPSLYEGFGLPVIEAMAAGVPVACSNSTSLPEVASDAAILFDPRVPTQVAQAMISLTQDEKLRSQFVQAGLRRSAEFSDSQRMAREYWELFQHALGIENPENVLTGVYEDGWAGSALGVQVAPSNGPQTLLIELAAPHWLPHAVLTLQVRQDGEQQGESITLARGSKTQWAVPLHPEGGHYELSISPTFTPAILGRGDDQRELSAMLQRCTIKNTNGRNFELFSEKAAA